MSVTALGISTIITQLVTLRAFITVFAGNELVLGIILSNWLLLTGLGSYIGRHAKKLTTPVPWLVCFEVAIGLLPFVQLSLIRFIRKYHVSGLLLGIHEVFVYSLLILLPYCLISGFLLTFFVSFGGTTRDAKQIGEIYILDVLGDIIGGAIFSFLLIYYFSHFQVITFLLILILLATAILCRTFNYRKLMLFSLSIICLCLIIIGRFDLDRITTSFMFPGQNLLFHKTTPYGNLAVTSSGSQLTVYENGTPIGSTQDLMAAEENVHYALAQHPDFQNVLLVSGGLNGSLREVAKYSVQKIDYVELDPTIIDIVKKIAPSASDERITFIARDARQLISSQKHIYDAILINLPDPSTTQLNRFYSIEFFQKAKTAIRSGGILSFSLSGAENFAGQEIGHLASPIYNSLARVFSNIILIPGNRQYFIASDRPLSYDIAKKLNKKRIHTEYVNNAYLSARLTPDRIETAEKIVSMTTEVNHDLFPSSYFAHMRYWLSQFHASLLLPVIVCLAVLLAITGIIMRLQSEKVVAGVICATGFSGLGLEIVILLAFQIFYGYVYRQLGIIITAFLIGTALGALWSNHSQQNARTLLFRLDLLMGSIALLLGPSLFLMQRIETDFFSTYAPLFIFPLLTASIGFLVGAQLPPAAKLSLTNIEKTASALYSLDFLGAALGGILISCFIIPLTGITTTCYLIGGLKLITATMLRFKKIQPHIIQPIETKSPDTNQVLVFSILLLLFTAYGSLICLNTSNMTIYSLSFHPLYYWSVLLLAGIGIIRAILAVETSGRNRTKSSTFHRINQTMLTSTHLSLLRWINYFVFSLAVFFPIFSCYFKIPYLFCHVCPRQCIFGYLRPYLVPAALIMNLEKRFWCFRVCPIGTLFDKQPRLGRKILGLPIIFKTMPVIILIITGIAYFKVQYDYNSPIKTNEDWYTTLFINSFSPIPIVIGITVFIIILAFKLRRPFCKLVCPVGNLSRLLLKLEQTPYSHAETNNFRSKENRQNSKDSIE